MNFSKLELDAYYCCCYYFEVVDVKTIVPIQLAIQRVSNTFMFYSMIILTQSPCFFICSQNQKGFKMYPNACFGFSLRNGFSLIFCVFN